MKRVLDKVDEKILDELTRHARLAHNEIGLKVNLSRNAVRLRIERLERDGYIRGYTIVKGTLHGGSRAYQGAGLCLSKGPDARCRGGPVSGHHSRSHVLQRDER